MAADFERRIRASLRKQEKERVKKRANKILGKKKSKRRKSTVKLVPSTKPTRADKLLKGNFTRFFR